MTPELIEKLKALAQQVTLLDGADEEGNLEGEIDCIQDAFDAGITEGETELAREILNALNIAY